LESGNNNALLYDSLVQIKRKQDYHKEISKNTSLGQLSLAIGSLAGMAFVFISLRAVMIAAIIPAVIAFVITLRLVEAKKSYDSETTNFLHIFKSLKYLLKHKRLRTISLAETLHYGLNEAAFDFNSVFFKQFVPEWSLGIFRSIGHFANSLGNYLSFFAAKRWGLRFTILFGVCCDNFSNIISVLAASVWSPIIKIISTFCSGLKEPAEDTLIQNDCSEQERATLLSIISLFGSLFYSLCAVLIGMLADMTSPYTAMLCFYILALTSNSLFFVALKNTKK
jgi:MFS family permease